MYVKKSNQNMIIFVLISILGVLFIKSVNLDASETSCKSLMAFSGLVSYSPESKLDIYLMNPNENLNVVRITNDDGNYKLLGWSPDGIQLGLINTGNDIDGEGGGIPVTYNRVTNQILEMDLGSNNLEVFSFNWSPDGSRMLLLAKNNDSSSEEITYFLMESNNPATLENLVAYWTEDIIRVRWSPDGNTIAFESRDEQNQDVEIFLLSIEERNMHPTQLTNNEWNDSLGNWSHDGSQISFISDEYGNYDIYTLSLSTNTITRLTDNTLLESNPVWSYDDKYIAFRRDFNNLVILDMNSLIEQEIDTITPDLAYELVESSWLPNKNALSIREAQYETNPSEIYIYDLESSEVRTISQELPTKIIMAHNWSPCF